MLRAILTGGLFAMLTAAGCADPCKPADYPACPYVTVCEKNAVGCDVCRCRLPGETDMGPARDGRVFSTSCSHDGDCRLYSNYCGGCACDALRIDSVDPGCTGTRPICLVDPCEGRSAICVAPLGAGTGTCNVN